MHNVSHGLSSVELALTRGVAAIVGDATPLPLFEAIEHAVLQGGSRFRPRLVLAVAASAGTYDERFALHAAAAVEFLHAASLVHDDLPAFDDAALRRGAPSVHRKFGEAMAVLAGDALIVGAYDVLHQGSMHHARCHDAMRVLFRAGGAAEGLAQGQALELVPCNTQGDLTRYHRAKTGALFEAAASLGAFAADVDPAPWVAVGRELGLLYQTIDDLLDVHGDPQRTGKDSGNDQRHGRPTSYGTRIEPQIEKLKRTVPGDAPVVAEYIDELLAETFQRLRMPLAPTA